MTFPTKTIIVITVMMIAFCGVRAQDEGDDDPKGNVNLGLPISAPVNPTAQFVNVGVGATLGAGYNFTRRHAVVGEFMWNHLSLNNAAVAPLRAAFQNPGINAGSNLLAFTGNYRYELRGAVRGLYFIGGGGYYIRKFHLSQKVITGSNITCTPTWLWYGLACESGSVTADQALGSSSSHNLGVNGGIGFTARVGDAPYRVYVESRYHYAPGRGVSTTLVAVTIGIRY
ncbi:MAG: outer membrane beta-barrel protein [Candidatus Sulfotelmatobacter sp.]